MLRALAWSVAVVLVGGLIAAFTTPAAQSQTVVQQGAGLAVPAEQVGAGASGATAPPAGDAAAPGSSVAAPAGPASTSGPPAAASTATTAKQAQAAATPATKAAAPAPAPAAPKIQPEAGSYPLSISGSSSVDGKQATVPSSGSLVVEQRGSDQQHRTVGVPGGLVLVQRATAGGVDLISISLSAGSKTLSFRPPGPLAFVRTEPGASWSWSVRSTDGSVGLSQTATVSAGGSMTVGGTSVPTFSVQRVFTVSGAVTGTVRLTSAVSTVDRLPVRQHQVIDVKAGVLGLLSTHVVSDTTATLTSTRPR